MAVHVVPWRVHTKLGHCGMEYFGFATILSLSVCAIIHDNQGQIADNGASLAANKAEIASNGEAIQTLSALLDELRDQLTAANAEIEILKQEKL